MLQEQSAEPQIPPRPQDSFEEIVKALEKFRTDDQPVELHTDIALDLNLDSLAVMDLLMQIEESFDISIPLNMIPEIRTVADLTRVIDQLTEEA